MLTIKEQLNKIKWDKRENPKEYSIVYFDRVLKQKKEIEFLKIKKIEDSFLIVIEDEEVSIPLHRIREVKKSGRIIWFRQVNKEIFI